MITGNSLHESSSAPQQYKSVQYKWFAFYLHRDVSHTDIQESIQSSTRPGPGYQWESNKLTVRHHKREPRGQDNLQIYYSSASATVLSKGTEPR